MVADINARPSHRAGIILERNVMAWNKPNPEAGKVKTSQHRRARLQSGAIVLCLVAVTVFVVVLVYEFLYGHRTTENESFRRSTSLISEVDPSIPTKTVVETPDLSKSNSLFQAVTVAPHRPIPPGRKKVHSVSTNTSNLARKSIASNAVEQVMLSIFSRERGDMPPPLPRLSPNELKDLAATLIYKDTIKETDSPNIAFQKEALLEAKAALRNYIKEGGSAEDFFAYYHGELVKNYYKRLDAQRLIIESTKNDPPDVTEELCRKINEDFAQKGIKKIVNPNKFKPKSEISK